MVWAAAAARVAGLEIWHEVQALTELNCGTWLGDHVFNISSDFPGLLTAFALLPNPQTLGGLSILTSNVSEAEFVRTESGPQKKQQVIWNS